MEKNLIKNKKEKINQHQPKPGVDLDKGSSTTIVCTDYCNSQK